MTICSTSDSSSSSSSSSVQAEEETTGTSSTTVESPVVGCPYAAALQQQHQQQPNQKSSSSAFPEFLELQLAKEKCPAFQQQQTCPFSQAKSPKEVQQTLLQLPPSHYEPSGVFYKSLQHLHLHATTTTITTTPAARFFTECPVKHAVPQNLLQQEQPPWMSFHQAMEEYSLAAIMARMAQELEGDGKEQGEKYSSPESPTAQKGIIKQTFPSSPPPPLPTSPSSIHTTSTSTTTSSSSSSSSTTTTTSSSTGRLAEALKTGTALSHTQAEGVHFVKNFIRGSIDRHLYGQLVWSLYHVYQALEDALDQHAPHYFPSCHYPNELYRTPSLQDDVHFWHATRPTQISQATLDYIQRIRDIAQSNPLLLLSHAYTRYLGDLSGGKILERVARRALQLERDGEGLAFYQFPNIDSAKLFKDQYRASLNAMGHLSSNEIQQLVTEANIAFGLNMRLFEELDVMGGVPGATVRPLNDILQYEQNKPLSSAYSNKRNMTEIPAECPFASTTNKSMSSTMTTKTKTKTTSSKSPHTGQCPWPFIFFHNPTKGMQCWQTWLIVGLLAMYLYSNMMNIMNQLWNHPVIAVL